MQVAKTSHTGYGFWHDSILLLLLTAQDDHVGVQYCKSGRK